MILTRSATSILADLKFLTHEAPRAFDYDVKDAKGRAVGAIIRVALVEYVEKEDNASWGYTVEPDALGEYWQFTPQATRNGVSFGPCQPSVKFRTRAAMENAIDTYLANARKRALKAAK